MSEDYHVLKRQREEIEQRQRSREQAEIARLQEQNASLTARLNAKLYECPECAFTFLASHTDEGGGYSCPCCAEAKLTAQLAALEWQPIETVPKDGTAIIVATDDGVGEACYHGEEGDYYEGWWWANTDYGDYYADKITPGPTHWRPLPAPPMSEDQRQQGKVAGRE